MQFAHRIFQGRSLIDQKFKGKSSCGSYIMAPLCHDEGLLENYCQSATALIQKANMKDWFQYNSYGK